MMSNLSISPAAACQNLNQRSLQFDAIIAEHAIDQHGIAMAQLWRDPIRPLIQGDIDSSQSLVNDTTVEELYAYEDAGMTTGAYLASQSIRYRLTGEQDARDHANTAFEGIRYIYELGKSWHPGYFPKPYGARYSEHFSRDQYLFVMSGLAEYHRIAEPAKQTVIRDMLQRMAEHWIKIDYRVGSFGLPSSGQLDDFMGSLFLGIMGIAADITGQAPLQREYERLFHTQQLGRRMLETLTSRFRDGHPYDGAMYYRQSENAMMMKAMAIDYLWNCDPDHHDLWRQSLSTFWNDDLLVPLDPETGLNYFIVGYDSQSANTFLTEPGKIEALENPLRLAILDWGGKRQQAGSTQTAFASAIIAHRLSMPEARDITRLILSKLTIDRFQALIAPNAQHVPPGHEFEQNLLNSGYIAYWLWTYWLATDRSLIAD